MTLQNAPPGLDYDRDRRFSKVVLVHSANSWLLIMVLWQYLLVLGSRFSCYLQCTDILDYGVYPSNEGFSVVISLSRKWLQCAW